MMGMTDTPGRASTTRARMGMTGRSHEGRDGRIFGGRRAPSGRQRATTARHRASLAMGRRCTEAMDRRARVPRVPPLRPSARARSCAVPPRVPTRTGPPGLLFPAE